MTTTPLVRYGTAIIGCAMLAVAACGTAPRSTSAPTPAPNTLQVTYSPTGSTQFGAEDGLIPDRAQIRATDLGVPAIAKLDPALRDALIAASRDAAVQNVTLNITSGWRSVDYQRYLFDNAVVTYGSRTEAMRVVAAPEKSEHVRGTAVDIGPTNAADWMIRHGSDYGLCQMYANEMWHFELGTTVGGQCPQQFKDAATR